MQLDELKRGTAERIARYWSRMARPVWASVGATIFLLATLGAATAEPKRVLMLHSFGRDFKPWSEYARNIPCGANISLLEQEFLNGSQEALGVWLSGNSQTARQIRWIQKCLK
jgi:hypothetical protein